MVHQPTVEYTPFETQEHAAPFGNPRDDEPRLVAARGVPRRDEVEDEVHAYAAAPRGDTAEHAIHDDEPEVRPPVPLRRAPERSAKSPRKRPAPNAPRRRPPSVPRSSGSGGHWGRRIFALVALIVIAVALYVVNATFQPFHGDGEGTVAVEIPRGADAGRIGEILAEKGVIDSARFFELNATISGDRGNLRPGRYQLKRGMTNGAAIDALVAVPDAPKAVETVSVTIVEGPSRRENAPVVDDSKKVDGSYARASSSKETLARIRELGAPKGTKTAEGFLFPATYELKAGSTANDLVSQQLDAFEDNFAQIDMSYAKKKKLTRYDVLIIASMIEREAQLARERSLVSAVIYNRLKQGMPLGIDATTRYSTNNWQRPILQSELTKDEPYNTRLNLGLPPTPIGNPGLASLKAAAKPADKTYLFYVRKPGKSGEHAFSSTDAQFERDRQRYEDSRQDHMIRLGVCGWPVAHSRSPQMHNAALALLGLRRLALPTAAAPAAPVHGDGAGAAEARLPRRERDDPAQGAGARARGRRHGDRDGDRGGEHAHVPARRDDPRRQHRRRRLPQHAQDVRVRPHGARAGRGRLLARDRLRAAPGRRARGAHLESQPGARAGAGRRVRRRRERRARRHHRQLHLNWAGEPRGDVQGATPPGR